MSIQRTTSAMIGTVIVASFIWSSNVFAGEFTFNPLLTVSEEFTDNVHEEPVKKNDYITRVLPGFTAVYRAPIMDLDAGYTFDYRYYAQGSKDDEITHDINAKGLVRLIDERLFLELSDVYSRVSLDVRRIATNESLSNNQTDRNVGTVSPYLVVRPMQTLMLKTGYRYVNTWFKSERATNRQAHVGFLDATYEMSSALSGTVSYAFTRELYTGNALTRHEVYVGPRYNYADRSFVFAQGGVMLTNYDHTLGKTVCPTWKAGLTHAFNTLLVSLSTDVVYSDDPMSASTLDTSYRATITKEFARGNVVLSGLYSELEDTASEKLVTKRYNGSITSSLELMQDLHGTLGVTYEYFVNTQLNAITRRYYVSSSIAYQLSKNVTSGVQYNFSDFSSAQIADDNYRVNRVLLEVKLAF